MLLACISPPCVSLLAIILNTREISCTKGVCRPFPQGPRRESQPCLSLWPLMETREVQSRFVASLRHCPYLSECLRSGSLKATRRVRRTRRVSDRRGASMLGAMRNKPYFDPTHRPSTITQPIGRSRGLALTLHPNTGLPRSKTPTINSLDRLRLQSACFLSYHTSADFLLVQDADLCKNVSFLLREYFSKLTFLPFVASLGKRSL